MMPQAVMTNGVPAHGYSRIQLTTLVLLRMFIGWHFLYEGLAKLTNPYWTSAGYLAESEWWFSGFFQGIAANATALTVVDYVNVWGLTIIGLGLMLGLFTRTVTVAGMILLLLYYVAAPPFAGYTYPMPAEGSYLVVNKTLIELVALGVLLAFPTGSQVGLDRLLARRRHAKAMSFQRAHA